ncbi:MAG: hypothetical protein NWF05_08940 [Candidatus Bathyarchaeota archaeon]|nr:hypothetical protein [Candidatus Bathyarchaeota archaeon]
MKHGTISRRVNKLEQTFNIQPRDPIQEQAETLVNQLDPNLLYPLLVILDNRTEDWWRRKTHPDLEPILPPDRLHTLTPEQKEALREALTSNKRLHAETRSFIKNSLQAAYGISASSAVTCLRRMKGQLNPLEESTIGENKS